MTSCPTCGTAPTDSSITCATCGSGTVATRRVLPMPQAALVAPSVTQHYAPQQYAPPPAAPQYPPAQPAYAQPTCAPAAHPAPASFSGYPGAPGMPGQSWPSPPTKWLGLEHTRWVAIAAGVMVLGVIIHFQGGSGHTITGTQKVYASSAYDLDDGSSCDTYGGYSDVSADADVYLTNASGDQVGRGTLRSGTVDGGACVFNFTIGNVPDSSEYGIRIGHRNTVTFTKSEMENHDWSPVITLGDD